MCNFNKQDEDTKGFIHLFLTKGAAAVGGANYLLALIEAIKAKKPAPLLQKGSQIASNNTIIKWNKVIFKDKLTVIENILTLHKTSENPNLNILNEKNEKKRKALLNVIKALSPVEFQVTPQNHHDGLGFSFKVFDIIDDETVKINPVFVAMFFCSTEFTKKALKYEI